MSQTRKAKTMSETLNIGDTTITVADDEFANAFQTGYLRYKVDYLNKPLTDMDLYAFYVGTMTSVQHAGRYNAGYLTGWVAALLERKHVTATFPVLPCTQRCGGDGMSSTQRWTATTRKKQPTAAERRATAREQALLNCQQGKHTDTPTFRPGETVCMTCGLVVYCPVCLDVHRLSYPLAHAHPLTCSTHRYAEVQG